MTQDPNDATPTARSQPAAQPPRRTVLVGAAAALAPVAIAAPPSLADHPLWNKPAPPLAGVTVQGAQIDIARLRGKVVVIEFWGVWCPDCRNDAQHTAALAKALASRSDTAFLTVHRRERFNRWPTLQAYFDEMQFSFPTLLDADETMSNTWQVKWVPSYYVLDRTLRVAHMRTDLGPLGGDELLAIVDKLRKTRG
jgi:thiol-disulfide isomerase/thioredoxin